MKKLVLIFTLLFAISMQANTIDDNQKRQDVNQITQSVSFEMPDRAGHWYCTSKTVVTKIYSDDGLTYDEATVTIKHCEWIE